MNVALIAGRLTRDAEMRQTGTGKAVTQLSVATNEKFGEDERTEFHTVIAWEKAAERVASLKKGDAVMVQGRLQTRKWDKDGVTHYKTEIVATNIEFLRPKREPIDPEPIF
jgi:single-strand DNA-binding protein